MNYNNNWEVVIQHTCLLGESPLWDDSNNLIYWVDILNNEIHSYSLHEKIHRIHQLDQMVGAVGLNASGGLVAALKNGIALVDLNKESKKMVATPEENLPGNRFNDGKCGPGGRFWAGTMAFSGESGAGSLYAMEGDFSVSTKIHHVSCSNGLAWSLDFSVLYYIDTPTYQVAAYEFDITTGHIKNKRIVINIPGDEGLPDGMTIDSDGMLWIAYFNGWKVARWDPHKGQLLKKIFLPVAQVTSCTFGGPHLEDLYITTAKTGLSDKELKSQPLAGSLFVIKNSGFKGTKSFKFQENIQER